MGFLSQENQAVTFDSLQGKLNKETETLRELLAQLKSVGSDYVCIAKQLVERLQQYSFIIKSYRQFIGKVSDSFEDTLAKHLSKSNSLGNIHLSHLNLDTIKFELSKTLIDSKKEITQSRGNTLKKDVINYQEEFNTFFLTMFRQLSLNYPSVSCQPVTFA